MGKRVRADFFLEHVREHGTHFCTYLLGTDMEMTTPAGYRLMNWETGYGDWVARPDFTTLRRIPWLEGTALVLADAVDEETGELIPVAPRTILRCQVERAAAMGFRVMMASELEFYLLKDSYDEAHEKGYRGLRPYGWYNEDYHLFQGTKAEPIYRQIRNLLSAAGIPIEFSKGRPLPASTRSTSITLRPSNQQIAPSSSSMGSKRSPTSTASPSLSWPSRTTRGRVPAPTST